MAPRGIPNDITTATRPMISPPMMRSFFCAPLRRALCGNHCHGKVREESGKSSRKLESASGLLRARRDDSLVGWSVDLVNLHGCVDGKIGVADRGTGGSRSVPCGGREVATGAFDGIGIAVAFGAGHRQGTGRDEFVQQNAAAIQRNVA